MVAHAWLNVLVWLIAMNTFVSLASAAESCLKYEPERVALTGTLILRSSYGPPNYGEDPKTDSIETQGLVLLDEAICVEESRALGFESEKDQLLITLVPPTGVDFSGYTNKRVQVAGTLFHALTGHHRTLVLMTVEKIQEHEDRDDRSRLNAGSSVRRRPSSSSP